MSPKLSTKSSKKPINREQEYNNLELLWSVKEKMPNGKIILRQVLKQIKKNDKNVL